VTTPEDAAEPVELPSWLRRATPVVFLALASPTLAKLMLDDLGLDQAAVRCLVALLVAVVSVQLLTGLLRGYATPPAPPEPTPAIEPEPAPARRAEDAPAA
jgi:hypothetical protein